MKILGQDVEVLKNQISALILNLWAWFYHFFPFLAPSAGGKSAVPSGPTCVSIPGPGGLDKLVITPLNQGKELLTVGYNVPAFRGPLVNRADTKNKLGNLVIVRVMYFSINYADVCIRWGLYESALRYVGWPIVPGFDFSGVVEEAGEDSNFRPGDEVFGFTLFGSYSSRLLVPSSQIRAIPQCNPQSLFSLDKAAALPAVAATALHAVRASVLVLSLSCPCLCCFIC